MPVRYSDDRGRAEAIILEATRRHALDANTIGEEVARGLDRRLDLQPRVSHPLTRGWLEMTVRFVCRGHGTRPVKDQIVRDSLAGLDGVGLAAAAHAIVAVPATELTEAGRPDRHGRMDSERGDVPA